jgi:hypothetical protein
MESRIQELQNPSTLTQSQEAGQTQNQNQQLNRWAQGCQAIFAGFVASAQIQNVSYPALKYAGEG